MGLDHVKTLGDILIARSIRRDMRPLLNSQRVPRTDRDYRNNLIFVRKRHRCRIWVVKQRQNQVTRRQVDGNGMNSGGTGPAAWVEGASAAILSELLRPHKLWTFASINTILINISVY